MKKVLIAFFFFVHATCAYPQVTRDITFRINSPDTSNHQFFDNHLDISWMLVDFEGGEPISLSFYHDSNPQKYHHPESNKDPDEFYDLEFEGDVYRLSKKYKKINTPQLPKIEMVYLPGVTDATSIETYYEAKAAVYRDSIVYQFDQNHYSDQDDITIYTNQQRKAMFDPRFEEGSDQLAKMLEINYDRQQRRSVTDSILIFRGVVERDGSLKDIELVLGERSTFSNTVQQGLEESSDCWVPATRGGRPVRFAISIYIRLNNDKSITVSTGGLYGRNIRDQ